MRLISFNTSL